MHSATYRPLRDNVGSSGWSWREKGPQ
jgi:hypothetical protein